MYPETFRADYTRLERTPFTRDRMQNVQCVIVGAGALGNEVARILGLLGTPRLVVIDPDVVELSNLPRSIFFAGGDSVGQNKAHALVESAAVFFPDTDWTAIGSEIADIGFGRLTCASLLFSCVDSDLARIEIAYISGKLQIPVVDGGLDAGNFSHGRVTCFAGAPDCACYGCMLTPRKRRELLELWQATLRPCMPGTNAGLGSTPTMAGIVGCVQAELGLRTLFEVKDGGRPSTRSYEIQIHPARRMEEFTIPICPDCPFHGEPERLCALPRENATLVDLLDDVEGETIVLDWPICVAARCSDCGKEWAPMLRLAALRRSGRCPACASSQVLELETIRTIGRDSPWLRCTPSALQLPADHLFTVLGAAISNR